ncbi:hypothetical protein SAMN05444920_127108 [Nonomuraea solani]|uniref:Uncharacterized protein n=1 Tax=Nonomuraea solani TaxID=1144553 RepID=A0A1H6F0B1_9ACTN|nr:hypothetical protein [Nonomuraea solani]SEH02569.1 hypothetical protein SAMN05444920_127108 [Nonomuraea solani]
MAKTPRTNRAARLRLWRIMAIVVLAAVLVWFFADPLHLPAEVLEVLDQRASVVGMFTGMALGAAALLVSVAALRAQVRAERAQQAEQPAAGPAVPSEAGRQAPSQGSPRVSASGERSVAIGGDNSGIVSTGDGARNVQMRAQASGQGRVYQAAGDQTIHEGDDRRHTYGGDHLEFHHNTLHGKVVGKQVTGPESAAPDRDNDGRH